MSEASGLALASGDVVAVRLPPGEAWRGIVDRAWNSGAAIFPVDHRLPGAAAAELLARSRPTVVVDHLGWSRRSDGIPGDGDLALIIATSGSRDRPRLVELGRSAVTAAVEDSIRALGADGHNWVSCLPLAHIGGLLVVLRSLLTGAPLDFRDPLDLAAPPPAAFTSVVPAILARALEAGADLSGYQALIVGGGPFPAALAARARAAGVTCVHTYGLTQTCGGVIYDGSPLRRVGMRITSAGEVEIGGSTVMRGYRDDRPGGSAGLSDDGWVRTGDAGSIDERGRLHVLGRLDDIIVTGGEKVWPPDVEAVLRRHPQVGEVVVVGRDDPVWGQRVVAFIVPRPGLAAPSPGALNAWVAAELGRHQAPREVVAVDQLPRTALGKVRVGELLARLPGAGDGGPPALLGDDGGG